MGFTNMGYDPFRNYDAWKTASPYDDCPEPWEMTPRCGCGAWLRRKPDRVVPRESRQLLEQIDGTEEWETHRWNDLEHDCRKCGNTTKLTDW